MTLRLELLIRLQMIQLYFVESFTNKCIVIVESNRQLKQWLIHNLKPKSITGSNTLIVTLSFCNQDYTITFKQSSTCEWLRFILSYDLISQIVLEDNITKDGLFWKNNDNVLLTNSPKEFCDYFTLDYDKWIYGFNNKEEFVDWISTFKLGNDPLNYFNAHDRLIDVNRKRKFNDKHIRNHDVKNHDVKKCKKYIVRKVEKRESFISWLDSTSDKKIEKRIKSLIRRWKRKLI